VRLWWGIVILLAISVGGTAVSLELSTIVLPSEDEVVEALENGEITYQQYLHLREIIVHGIDSTSLYLLDEIPNLVYIRPSDQSLSDPAETEQQPTLEDEAVCEAADSSPIKGCLGYRFYQQLDETERTWYRTSGNLVVAEKYQLRFKVDREKSGRERVVSRSLGYSGSNGVVRRFVLGSFTARLGLGTVFGYAGKRLDYADNLSYESLLYPDYGGYNGVLIDARVEQLKMTGLFSVQRDPRYRLVSIGVMTQLNGRRLRPGLIFGLNRLTNRHTGQELEIPMVGIYGEHRYESGYLAFETSRQAGNQVSAGCVVVEGRHRFKSTEVRYSGWSYSDDLVDLTTGSKSVYLSRTDTLQPVGLKVSMKRPGQSGLLIKTVVQLSDKMKFSNAVLCAARGSVHQRQQFSSSIIRSFDNKSSILLTYLGKSKRNPQDDDNGTSDHRIRLESRFLADRWSARCYVGYNARTDDRGSACLFGSLRYKTAGNCRVYLWSNLGDLEATGINYWYLFVRAEWPMMNHVRVAAKLSNRYRRGSSDVNRTQLSLELNADL